MTMSVLVDKNTAVLVQGVTGREATIFTKDCLDYGARIVAGVTPGKGGFKIHNVPVYDCVKSALTKHLIDASIVSVPPSRAKDAALEAIANGIRLIVVITERIPRQDVVQIINFANEKGSVVIGPNSVGIISPNKTKLGPIGGRLDDVNKSYSEGPIGIISRSGGMTTEIANLLTLGGLGQSTCVSIGGDPIIGSTFVDLVPLFTKDPQTKGIVIFGEPGGVAEEELAEYIKRNGLPLPIVSFVAGRFVDEIPGVRFGHAGTIVEGERGKTQTKIKLLKEAGVLLAEELSEIPHLLRKCIS